MFMRYEKITETTTGGNICDTVTEFLPQKYKHLKCKLSIAGSNELLDKDDKLIEVLRPIEFTLDVVLDASKLDKRQISQAIAVIRTALAPYDASAVQANFEQIVPESTVSQNPLGQMRPVTPPRGPMRSSRVDGGRRITDVSGHVPRPVFGVSGPSHGAADEMSLIDRTAAAKTKAAPEKVFVTYQELPSLQQKQHEFLYNFVDDINQSVDRKSSSQVFGYKLIFESKKGRDPLEVPSSSMDYALRQLAMTWKVILPALGKSWTLEDIRDGCIEVVNGHATVFIEVHEFSINTEDRSRHREGHDRERRRRRRRPDEDRDPSPKRGRHTERVHPALQPGSTETDHSGHSTRRFEGHVECSPVEIPATVEWSQPVSEEITMSALVKNAVEHLREHLSAMAKSSLPLGGYEGYVAHCPPLLVQSHPMKGIRSGSVNDVRHADFPSLLWVFVPA